jgi:hypothetical protein
MIVDEAALADYTLRARISDDDVSRRKRCSGISRNRSA